MTMGRDNNGENRTSGGSNKWWIAATILLTVLICSATSWLLISRLTVTKPDYASDIININNAIGQLQDETAGLNNYSSYHDSTVQTSFDNIESEIIGISNDINGIRNDLTINNNEHATFSKNISDIQNRIASISSSLDAVTAKAATLDTSVNGINTAVTGINNALADLNTKVAGLDTAINDASSGLKTAVNNLTATVNGISGLQIIPTISSSTASPGTISLAINSIQTVTSQTIAFSVEFFPKSDYTLSTTSIDTALQSLYTTPPVTLTPVGSAGTAVTADHITYNLKWKPGSPGSYYLGSITFTTLGTSITKGTQTKTLAFSWTGATAYDVVITPIFESATNSQGGAITTW